MEEIIESHLVENIGVSGEFTWVLHGLKTEDSGADCEVEVLEGAIHIRGMDNRCSKGAVSHRPFGVCPKGAGLSRPDPRNQGGGPVSRH